MQSQPHRDTPIPDEHLIESGSKNEQNEQSAEVRGWGDVSDDVSIDEAELDGDLADAVQEQELNQLKSDPPSSLQSQENAQPDTRADPQLDSVFDSLEPPKFVSAA